METIRFLQSFYSPFLDFIAEAITMLGEDTFFILLAVITIWCFDKKNGLRLGIIALSSAALNVGLKAIFRHERPIGLEGIRSLRLQTAGGYSFPSGHSQFAATTWTKLALLIKRRWFSILAAILVVLVGLSRIYLGVHFPKDVLAGFLIGFSWVLIADKLLNIMEKKPKSYLFLGILLLFTLPFFQNQDYYKVISALSGLFMGIYLEKTYINFTEKAPLAMQFSKVTIGIAGLLAIQNGLKLILPLSLYSDALRYFLIGLWAIAIAPSLFKIMTRNINRVGGYPLFE